MKKKKNDLTNQLKQALADYHNLSKRIKKRQSDWQDQAAGRIVDKLLDVYDDLCRAEQHLQNKGLTMAVNQFWAVMESEGTEKIKSDGEVFDPELMDCVQVVKGKKNIVAETVTRGYKLNGRVVRPAKVKVGKGGK